jgi:A/G-specific adenine glycosylase
MLQQTQVDRVIPKYEAFLKRFPSFKKLADASVADVLREWQGLGYNRRALSLKRTAEGVMQQHGGSLPSSYEELIELPGIGPYTAGALRAFIWNQPEVFIETNIRTVYIHHFFPMKKVGDDELRPLIEKTLDTEHPREWYYALMDYGAHLKKSVGNASRGSAHYKKQSPFKGSRRQLRGAILRELMERGYPAPMLAERTGSALGETKKVLDILTEEGLLEEKRGLYRLSRRRSYSR